MSAPLPTVFGRRVRRLHCVGVGGMGLGPLAIYLADLGFFVSGEDDALTEVMRKQLEQAGVRVSPMGTDCELVVCSSAISVTHPAALLATERVIPIVRRGELLAEVVRGRKLVAVCGAHGKTTTTAMLITALRKAGLPFGYILGGLFADDSIPPASAGGSEWIVAEIDESDGTIGCFSPEITVATNLDWDHPDFYRSPAELAATFSALFARTKGTVLVSEDCTLSTCLAASVRGGMIFGTNGDFKYSPVPNVRDGLQLSLDGKFGISLASVRARGLFNAANAAAALAAAQLMGAVLSPTMLADYPSVKRRQGIVLAEEGLTVIEDYAHHPAEIRALLDSLRAQVRSPGRLIVAFQPHRFSRTLQFRSDFAAALSLADQVHLLDVYAAGENPMEGGASTDLLDSITAGSFHAVRYHGADARVCFKEIEAGLQPGDWVVVIGAGDIDQRARQWVFGRKWDRWVESVQPQLSSATMLVREEPLAEKTTMRVGGAARVYAEPSSIEDLRTLLVAAKRDRVRILILGRGSNVLIPDEGVDALVISFSKPVWATFEDRGNGYLWVGAGMRLKNFCGLAGKAGLKGFEFLEGIPGTVGGALRMNAGAMGGWIFDLVSEVQVMFPDGELRMVSKDDMKPEYRRCPVLEESYALGALMGPFSGGNSDDVLDQIEAYRLKRQESQPREPSAGCVFKNPPGESAGRLIDECWLKGERIGGAEVSNLHANFIVNRDSATASDIMALIRRVRTRVREIKGIELEPEVLLFGRDWKDVL